MVMEVSTAQAADVIADSYRKQLIDGLYKLP
jgi:hypothetical protein